MACSSCKHFSALQTVCRRYPPKAQCVGIQQSANPQGQPLVVTFWPTVQAGDTCGEFAPDIKLVN